MLLSVTTAHRPILLILSTFVGVLVPGQHSSILRIKAKFSLAFIHALILLLGSFLLFFFSSAKRNDSIPCSFLQNMKTQVLWTIHAPLEWFAGYIRVFFLFSLLLWPAGRLWCKWHLANGLKTPTSQKVVCPLIHNSLADASALGWLLVFADLGNSFPVT